MHTLVPLSCLSPWKSNVIMISLLELGSILAICSGPHLRFHSAWGPVGTYYKFGVHVSCCLNKLYFDLHCLSPSQGSPIHFLKLRFSLPPHTHTYTGCKNEKSFTFSFKTWVHSGLTTSSPFESIALLTSFSIEVFICAFTGPAFLTFCSMFLDFMILTRSIII